MRAIREMELQVTRKASDETYDRKEANRRTETALRAAFSAPHKTYEESKVGKATDKRRKSPARRRVATK